MNYYGSLNEMKEGLAADLPEKPQALVLWEQCTELQLPLVSGGLMDQPFIWLQEVAVVKNVEALFKLANQRAVAE